MTSLSQQYMGDRNCAFDDCNSLEFRNTNYCLKHKDSQSEQKLKSVQINSVNNKSNTNYGPTLIIMGFPIIFLGYRLQSQRVTHWFEGLINPIYMMCGFSLIFTGILFLSYGVFLLKNKSKKE